jgi:hypothetical protein
VVAGGGYEERIPHSLSRTLERLAVAVVVDDIVTSGSLEGRRKLDRHQPVYLFRGQHSRGQQTSPPRRLAGVDQDHGIELGWVRSFEQQWNVTDNNPIAAPARLTQQREPAPVHRGMDDPVQCTQRLRLGQNLGSKFLPIQSPIGKDHRGTESLRDGGEHRLSRGLELADQLVGIDDGGPPAAEQLGHRRFAGSNVSGEGDREHGEKV